MTTGSNSKIQRMCVCVFFHTDEIIFINVCLCRKAAFLFPFFIFFLFISDFGYYHQILDVQSFARMRNEFRSDQKSVNRNWNGKNRIRRLSNWILPLEVFFSLGTFVAGLYSFLAVLCLFAVYPSSSIPSICITAYHIHLLFIRFRVVCSYAMQESIRRGCCSVLSFVLVQNVNYTLHVICVIIHMRCKKANIGNNMENIWIRFCSFGRTAHKEWNVIFGNKIIIT